MTIGTPEAADADWRRLSTLTLVLAVLRLGPGTLNIAPALAGLGIATRWTYVGPALLVFLMASLGYAWLAWARFRWRLSADAITIESGVLARQQRTIPFDRIQDVSIEQGVVARMLEVAKVGFETGAASAADEGEGKLDSISIEEAERLRAVIRAWRTGMEATTAGVEAGASAEAVPHADSELFTMSPKQLVVAGVFNGSLTVLLLAFALLQYLDNFLPADVFNPRVWFEAARESGVESWISAHRWAAGAGVLVVLAAVVVVSGILRMFLTNWDFRLTLAPRAFRRVRGLTTRTDVAIPLRRVQAAVVTTGRLSGRWGWHELRLQSLASDSAEEKDHQLIPFGQLEAVDRVLEPVQLPRPAATMAWHRLSVLAQAGGAFLWASVLALGGAASLGLGTGLGRLAGMVALGLSVLWASSALLAARTHAWAEADAVLYIRRGWWTRRLTILPFSSVQSADLVDGPVLRRLGCVVLVLGVPGESSVASHLIDGVPAGAAAALRARVLAARVRRTADE